MGSLSLVCPMCCGESFDNSQSLKYHLLSMTDNLYCPNCAQRSDSVAALIQHLDNCGEFLEASRVEEEEHSREPQDENLEQGFLATVSKDGILIVGDPRSIEINEDGGFRVVERMEEDREDEDSMENIGRTIKATKSDDVKESTKSEDLSKDENESVAMGDEEAHEITPIKEDEKDQSFLEAEHLEDPETFQELDEDGLLEVKQEICEEESLYSCSSCGMSFNSVLEHIKEYHDGQEVVLEMAEQQMDDLPAEEDSNLVEEHPSDQRSNQSNVPHRQRQTMNTLRTEECVDSEGRLYTRKVVQIERFWDRSAANQAQPPSKSGPMIEKFFSNVEGVKMRAKCPPSSIAAPSTVVPQRTYRCNKCLEQFSKLGDFRIHVCLNGNNQCELCEQAFASAKALQIHSRIHQVEAEGEKGKNFVCPICATEFSSHKSLRLHSRMHAPVRARHVDAPEGTEKGDFTCLECGKTLSESYRIAHMALHKGDSVTCTICNRKFDSSDSLAMHAAVHIESGQSHHEQQLLFIQSQEEANAENRQSGDVVTDPIEIQKPYQCQHCGRRFTRPHEKVKHERIHTGEKPHACEVCGKTFRVSYCLTLHMRTHTGVRPYACQHCGKRFKASSVYNHHLLTHGEERAYTCPYCPKTFKTRVQLAGHKNSHTKPFHCTECSRPFASLYAARAHIQTHKKDNNLKFSCYICGASYGRAFALKDHLKVHEKQDVPPSRQVPGLPEAAREEEVTEDYLIVETDEFEDLQEIEPDEKELVAVAASADSSTLAVEDQSE